MANVFTLWGELKADTRNFEQALIRADKEIKTTEKNLERLERQTKSYGMTSAATGRSQQRFGEAIAGTKKRLTEASSAFDQGMIGHRKMASILSQTESRLNSYNSKLKDSAARARDWHEAHAGQGFNQFVQVLGVATAAVGAFAIKSAMHIENARNKFTALEGSVEAANKRIKDLLDLSRKNVGVNFTEALQTFGQLKVLGTVSDAAINKMIMGLGRLRLAFDGSMGSTQDFLLNLQQLFDQGFEAQDWKQAIGRVQIFEQLLEKAFGTKDPEKLKEMKAAGKLTMEQWIAGFAEAALTDSRLTGLRETFSVLISKALTEVNIAIGPLGQKLIDAISPALRMAMEELQKDDPNYQVVGERIAHYIGKGVGQGLVNTDWHKMIADRIKSDLEGKTIPIVATINVGLVKGLMEGMGYTPDFSGIKQAFYDLVRVNTGHLQFLYKVMLRFPSQTKDMIDKVIAIISSGTIAGAAYRMGVSVGEGFINGLRSKAAEVAAYVRNFFSQHVTAKAEGTLSIESPSKVFFQIGKDVAQGFIDGLIFMREGVYKAMADMVDVSKIKGLTKKDAEAVRLATEWIKDLDSRTERTFGQELEILLKTDKFKGTNKALADMLRLLAQQKDVLKDIDKFYERIKERFVNLNAETSDMEGSGMDFTGGTGLTEAIGSIEDYTRSLENLMYIQDLAIGEPPRVQPWNDFWNMMRSELEKFKASLPSLKQALGENLINSIYQIGDVFANALDSWATRSQSFFSALADGFRQMISQIISELIRLMVMRAILALIGQIGGSFLGGLFGGAGGGGGLRGASSEFILTGGTSAPSFGGMSSFGGLAPAFAGGFGGMSSVTNNSTFSPTINVSGASSPQATAAMVKGEVIKALRQHEMRNK